MLQRRSTIQKMLKQWTTSELLRHIAFEIELEANHLDTIGAPIKAGKMRAEVTILEEAAKNIEETWQLSPRIEQRLK